MEREGSDNRFLLRYAAGEWIFREGDPGDRAFVVESGVVEITHEHRGRLEVLAHLGPGEMLGEMALIDGRLRSASARAKTDLQLRMITPAYLAERMAGADPMLRLLLRLMLARYRGFLSPGNAPGAAVADLDQASVLSRLQLEQDLALGLDRDEFLLHFQPIVRLSDLRTAGLEALIRWNSPTRGLLRPLHFVPVAEESDLIVRMGAWMLREGCAALRRLAPSGEAFMNLNLSGRQLLEPNLGAVLLAATHAAGVAPQRIKLEVTESLLMVDFDQAIAVLAALRAAGFHIAVDDFGTGYSSLSYLHRLPVDTLKIDQSFIQRIELDAPSRKIVAAIGALASQLGMDAVAEGVETAAQARTVRDMGIEYAQGYCFERMVPEAAVASCMDRQWSVD